MDQATAYREGKDAWPTVPLAEAEHAAAWALKPDQPPVHADDFFLGAAGGLRVEGAWDQIEEAVGPRVRRCLSFQATADYFIEDLWSDVLVGVMAELPEGELAIALEPPRPMTKLLRYRARVKLVGYLVLAGKRLAISRQRKRKPITGLPTRRAGEDEAGQAIALEDTRAVDPAEQARHDEAFADFTRRLTAAVQGLGVEQRFLLTQVYLNAGKQKEVAAQLGWTESKASRQLKSTLETLMQAVSGDAGAGLRPAEIKAWAEQLREILESAASPVSEGV